MGTYGYGYGAAFRRRPPVEAPPDEDAPSLDFTAVDNSGLLALLEDI